MSRILFAWELGAKLSHVAQHTQVAARLEEEGHDLVDSLISEVAMPTQSQG